MPVNYTLDSSALQALEASIRAIGGERVGRADPWRYREDHVLVCRITRAEIADFARGDDGSVEPVLTLEVEDCYGHRLSLIPPSYLRTSLYRAAIDRLNASDGPVGGDQCREWLTSKPWTALETDEIVGGDPEARATHCRPLVGLSSVLIYLGTGDAGPGRTAPHLFRVHRLADDADLTAVQSAMEAALTASTSPERGDL